MLTDRQRASLYMDVIEAIEMLAGDDFCEDLECMAAFHPEELTEREQHAAKKLSNIYRLAHSFNRRNICRRVHSDWRKQGLEQIKGLASL